MLGHCFVITVFSFHKGMHNKSKKRLRAMMMLTRRLTGYWVMEVAQKMKLVLTCPCEGRNKNRRRRRRRRNLLC